MNVETSFSGTTAVATVSGRVDSANAKDFDQELRSVIDKGVSGLVVDCSGLKYMSSAGLRVLLRVTRHLDQKHVPFVVCSLSPMISEVFQISGFDRIIPVATSRADALATLPR